MNILSENNTALLPKMRQDSLEELARRIAEDTEEAELALEATKDAISDCKDIIAKLQEIQKTVNSSHSNPFLSDIWSLEHHDNAVYDFYDWVELLDKAMADMHSHLKDFESYVPEALEALEPCQDPIALRDKVGDIIRFV